MSEDKYKRDVQAVIDEMDEKYGFDKDEKMFLNSFVDLYFGWREQAQIANDKLKQVARERHDL